MIGSVLGGIGGAIGAGAVLAGAAGKGGEKFLKQALEVWNKLKESNFDYRALTAPELKVFAEYMPEQYTAVIPENVRLAMDSQEGRRAQLGALGYFEGIRDQGIPLGTRLQVEDASRSIQDESQRAQNAIMQGLQARGRLGGGGEIQARIGGNQQAMELAHNLGGDILQQEIASRLAAAGAAGGIGSQLRGQDIALSQGNADAVNRFNAFIAQMKTEENARNAQQRQDTSNMNVGNRQRLGEQNALNRYNVDLENLNRKNSLLGQNFGQRYQIAAGKSGALGALADARYQEQAAKANTIMSLGQGLGQGIGGVGDLLGGGGFLGGGTQDFYQNIYGRGGRGGY